MTDFKDPEIQREILIDYLQVMIARNDWHGVADVEARHRVQGHA